MTDAKQTAEVKSEIVDLPEIVIDDDDEPGSEEEETEEVVGVCTACNGPCNPLSQKCGPCFRSG
jgi:hypothetical protein